MFIAAGSQIGWTDVYSKNIYDSIFEEKESEKPEGKKGCCCGTKVEKNS
jgi:hypothetical protein